MLSFCPPPSLYSSSFSCALLPSSLPCLSVSPSPFAALVPPLLPGLAALPSRIRSSTCISCYIVCLPSLLIPRPPTPARYRPDRHRKAEQYRTERYHDIPPVTVLNKRMISRVILHYPNYPCLALSPCIASAVRLNIPASFPRALR